MHADALICEPASFPEAPFDLVVSHFFLDCFAEPELAHLLSRVRHAVCQDAIWIVSDFAIPERAPATPVRQAHRARTLSGLRSADRTDHPPPAGSWALMRKPMELEDRRSSVRFAHQRALAADPCPGNRPSLSASEALFSGNARSSLMPSQKSMVAPSNTHLCLGLWLGGFPGPPPDVLPDPYPPPDPDGGPTFPTPIRTRCPRSGAKAGARELTVSEPLSSSQYREARRHSGF